MTCPRFLLQRPEFHALSAPALQSPQAYRFGLKLSLPGNIKVIENSKRYSRFRFYVRASPGQPATEMSNSLGRLVFASPTADMRAHDIKIKRHRRLWIDAQDYETSKLAKPSRAGALNPCVKSGPPSHPSAGMAEPAAPCRFWRRPDLAPERAVAFGEDPAYMCLRLCLGCVQRPTRN